MDGPMSRLPSSSVVSVNLAARRSIKDSFNSAPVTPSSTNSSYVDPPRPAKEGFEWVWFPAGYWAEREIVEAPGRVIKHFKWRKRSGKSSSGRATENDTDHSWDQTMQKTPGFSYLPNSFIAEESNVQSQRPTYNRHGTSSESGGSAFPLLRTPQAELPSPYLTEEAHVQSLQRSFLSNPKNSKTNSSESGTSFSKLAIPPLQSSPSTIEKGDSDATATPVPTLQRVPASDPEVPFSSFMNISPRTLDDKPRKSFMAKLLPEYKPKMKKTQSDNDAYDYATHTIEGARMQLITHHSQNSTPMMSRVASLLLREEGGGKKSWARSLKLFGRSPWHREASAGSEASASSSLRDVLRGRTPVASPASDIGPVKSLPAQFPGGEATRVKTPPLHKHGQQRGQPRSFFFDVTTPPLHPRSNSSSSSSGEWESHLRPHPPPPTASMMDTGKHEAKHDDDQREETDKDKHKTKRDSGKEWWEVPIAVPRYEAMAPASFEFDMPEHLPTSPMCPTNVRHKSGGTGVCVYHGRRKRSGGGGNEERSDDEGDDADVWT